MTKAICPRQWQAEAVRDGRLTGVERERFIRHQAQCRACAREVEALEALARALRASTLPSADALTLRRGSQRLLEHLDAERLGQPRWPRRVVGTFVAFVALVAAAVGWGFRTVGRAPSAALRGAEAPMERAQAGSPADASPPADTTSPVEIAAAPGAVWSRTRHDDIDEIHLNEGQLTITARSPRGATTLRVVTPDAELEDIGTVFTVAVDQGMTDQIVVDEGRVVVRLHGRPPEELGPGATWRRSRGAARASPQEAPRPSDPARRSRGAEPATSAIPPPGGSVGLAPHTAAAQAPDPADEAFEAALKAYRGGQDTEAARLFAAFEQQHPSDPHAEDASYLRVVVLLRQGRREEARAAARAHLARYPGGFRAQELEKLTR